MGRSLRRAEICSCTDMDISMDANWLMVVPQRQKVSKILLVVSRTGAARIVQQSRKHMRRTELGCNL